MPQIVETIPKSSSTHTFFLSSLEVNLHIDIKLTIKPKNLKLLNSMNSQHASMWQSLINERVPAKKYLNSLTFIVHKSIFFERIDMKVAWFYRWFLVRL
jgi:hypothetical protein